MYILYFVFYKLFKHSIGIGTEYVWCKNLCEFLLKKTFLLNTVSLQQRMRE